MLALCLVLSGPALAGTVSYEPATTDATAWIGRSNTVDWAQTFTVVESGTLSSVEVFVRENADFQVDEALLFDIRRTTAGGAPEEADSGTPILYSGSIAAADVGTTAAWLVFSGLGISVTDGEVLSITLRSDDDVSGAYQWLGTMADGYAGGSAYRRVGSSGTWNESPDAARDLAFRATVVPLPAAFWAGLTLLGGLGAVRRSRRRK